MAQGVVDQVGERALDELQVAIQFKAPRRFASQGHRRRPAVDCEFLHRVGHQLVEPEALAMQQLVARLQCRQFEELLRQAPHLVALRQRRDDDALALLGLRKRLAGQGFEVAVQGGQRRAQIVRDAGHGLAMCARLLLLARGLGFDAFGHFVESGANGLHFIASARRRTVPGCGGMQGVQAVVAHAPGETMQRLRQPTQGKGADRQGHQQTQAGHQSGTLPDAALAKLPADRFARLPVEDDVQVARRAAVAGTRREHRRAEDARQARTHRVAAPQGQGGATQEGAHRPQVDLLLLHHAGVADVGLDATVGVKHVNLDAGVNHHQHRQQRVARRAVGLVAVAHGNLGPVFDDVPGQPVRQALQRLLLVLGGDVPAKDADQRPVGEQEQGHGHRQARRK